MRRFGCLTHPLCSVAVALLSSACGQDNARIETVAGDDIQALPFDLEEVVAQTKLSYREEGDQFIGGRAAYSVRANRTGVVSFTARHWVDGEASADQDA